MFFKPRAVEDHIADWVEANFARILEGFSSDKAVRDTALVTPRNGGFVVDARTAEECAEQLFVRTAEFCGVRDWPIRLEGVDDTHHLQQVSALHFLESDKSAAGTFQVQSNELVITYALSDVSAPVHLIATFAHEIAHAVLAGHPVEREVPEEEVELLTDLMAVYLGFGVFLANSAFHFQQYSESGYAGWRSSRRGYLTQETLTYATALFCEIRQADHDVAKASLKPHLVKVFDKACKQIAQRESLAALMALDRGDACV
ncbi:hypothetical protein ACFELO_08240 [Oceanicaulis sp. LC35]|uniref:hypothetical protein n=1 Tax=Oceanicaulis sp. LC35 TaxID=3349635 RepID=UPI003F833F52